MQYDLTPLYLSSLVPPSISETTRYNLRNADDYTTLKCRAQLYYTSFVPSVIREWNALPGAAKQISTLHSFTVFLNQDKTAIPKYFNYGKRKSQVLHTRLRTSCSSLNNDLCLKNISQSPSCASGASVKMPVIFTLYATDLTYNAVKCSKHYRTYHMSILESFFVVMKYLAMTRTF